MPKKTAMLCALLFSAFVCLGGAAPAQAAGNTTNDSFNKAKRMLERQVYADHMVTIYCGYRYGADKKVELPKTSEEPLPNGGMATPSAWTGRASLSRDAAARKR